MPAASAVKATIITELLQRPGEREQAIGLLVEVVRRELTNPTIRNRYLALISQHAIGREFPGEEQQNILTRAILHRLLGQIKAEERKASS